MTRVLISLVAAAWAIPAAAQQPAVPASASGAASEFARRAAALDGIFTAEAAKGGSFIVRYERDGQVMSKGYGHLDCARSTPMPTDALIDSGSITKAFTTAAIYKLVEEGRLKLDDPLGELFRNVPADKRAITVAQLVDSRAGFHDFVEPDGRVPTAEQEVIERDYLPMTRAQLIKSAFASPLRYPPGTKEEYSNLGFQLLAAIIESASGRKFEDYVRDKVLLPAGMRNTGYVRADFAGLNFAEQCKGAEAWGDPVSKGLWKSGVSWNLLGAGGMMTTVEDLKRWTEAATNGKLFRPDIQARFRRTSFFVPSYKRCQSEVSGVAGANGLTFVGYVHLPLRSETVIVASTRSDHPAPQVLAVLCP